MGLSKVPARLTLGRVASPLGTHGTLCSMVNFATAPGSQATSGAVGPLIIVVVVELVPALAYPSFLDPENPGVSRQGREVGAGCSVARSLQSLGLPGC